MVLIYHPTRSWIAGFLSFDSVKESLDNMRCMMYVSDRSNTELTHGLDGIAE